MGKLFKKCQRKFLKSTLSSVITLCPCIREIAVVVVLKNENCFQQWRMQEE